MVEPLPLVQPAMPGQQPRANTTEAAVPPTTTMLLNQENARKNLVMDRVLSTWCAEFAGPSRRISDSSGWPCHL